MAATDGHAARARAPGLAALAALALCAVSAAPAHEILDLEDARESLAELAAQRAALSDTLPDDERASRWLALGETVEEVVTALNRRLAQHQGELGLTGELLVSGLRAQGIELGRTPTGRYRSYLVPFDRYLELAPAGPRHADALLYLLRGRFRDSFGYDPLQPFRRDWAALQEQMRAGERFLAAHPRHPGRTEVRFIVAVSYARAAHEAPDPGTARRYAGRARTALSDFARTHPGDLRGAAAEALLARLPAE